MSVRTSGNCLPYYLSTRSGILSGPAAFCGLNIDRKDVFPCRFLILCLKVCTEIIQ